MKHKITLILAVIFGVAAVFAGFAWYNNVCIALQWTPDIGKVYHGQISRFDRVAVDFSTVTTAIPFYGLALISIGLFRTASAKRGEDVSEHFPFFRWHHSFTTVLGLIGTVWGLIMIGYYNPDKVTMHELVYCLRTALYSTLIALIWVFFFAIPIGHIMRWWHGKVVGVRVLPPVDVISYMHSLVSAISCAVQEISNAGGKFSDVTVQVSAAGTKLGEVSKVLDDFKRRTGVDAAEALRNACGALATSCDEIKKTLNTINAESQARMKAAEDQQAFLQKAFKELEAERQARLQAEQRAAVAEKERDFAKVEAKAKRLSVEKETAEQRAVTAEAQLRKVKEALKV